MKWSRRTRGQPRQDALPGRRKTLAGSHTDKLHGTGRRAADGPTPPYLSVQLSELQATLVREPRRTEVPVLCDEQLVVEFYCR